ncbi:expansin-B15-like [Carex rostrata]
MARVAVVCNKDENYPTNGNRLCNNEIKPITITDECLHGRCAESTYHIDMSGIAFGSLADPGKEHEVYKAGKLPVVVQRVPCNYKGRNIHFHVSKGSNPYYLALLTEYQNGDGDLSKLEIRDASSSTWTPLKQSWGKIWSLHSPHPLKGPFSIRVTTLSGKWSLVAKHAIPADWKPDTKYDSKVNFPIDISPWLT